MFFMVVFLPSHVPSGGWATKHSSQEKWEMNTLVIGGISGIPYREKRHISGILGLFVGRENRANVRFSIHS